MVNFDNTLIVISTVDCDEFNQGIRSEKIGRFIAENFYSTLCVCDGEFLQHTLSNLDGSLR